MQWEIVIVVILVIGIFTAIREAQGKRAARKNEAGKAGGVQYTAEEILRKQNK